MNDTIRTFGKLTPDQRSFAGGKGGTLARLYQAGYPVPDGLVALPAAFVGDELSPQAWVQVRAHLDYLRGDEPGAAFAVRSSSLVEDSARASFAGEFETVLDVSSEDEVQAAIQAVQRSRHSERVRAYSQARGLETAHPGQAPEMAVIVQRLVRADISGVLFSADPVTGSRASMKGNYVHGSGEGLVSGQAQPETFSLERPRGRYQGPTELKPYARKLFNLARRLERDLEGPQDIEWAIAGGKVYLLQSRPITTLLGFDPLTGEFNDSLTGDYLWSCVNIGEALAVVMTPYTWSLVRRAFDELNLLPGYASAGNIGGRPYQNSTVMFSTYRAMGRSMDDLSKEMAGVRDEYWESLDQYITPLPEVNFFVILPIALRLARKHRRGLKNLEGFLAENPGWCRAACQRIQECKNKDDLVDSFLGEYLPHTLDTFWRTVATAWRQGELVSRLRGELTALVGALDADVLLSNVSRHDEPLASLGPLVGLTRVARGEMSRSVYLEKWGHRGPLETETSVPRPFEDPDWIEQQLEAFARSPVDVEGLLATRQAEFEAAWERLRERTPRKAKSLRRRIKKAAQAARMREAVRSEFTRLVWVARTWALRASELTGLGDGVFFMTYQELLDLLGGKLAPTETIPARRQTYERYKALPPYPLIIRGRFDPFQWAADPNKRGNVFDSHGLLYDLELETPSENIILGMPGSAGWAEGLARCLDSPEQGDELEPGEILVAGQTNIGWTLFFPRAAAIVTDVGAPLSHAAIVARELGIPAVVNCGIATTRLRTGDRVRVDGTQGTVEILETGVNMRG